MTDTIDALHDRAEELAGIAAHTTDGAKAEALREKATALVREAAALRGDAEDEIDTDADLIEPFDDEVMYE